MKLTISPRTDFLAAPKFVRFAYLALVAVAVLWFASQVVVTVSTHNWLLLVGNFVLTYLLFDTGLVILRGGQIGRGLGILWAFLASMASVITLLGINHQPPLVTGLITAAGVFALPLFVLMVSGPVGRHFAAAGGKRKKADIAAEKNRGAGDPKAGSWEDIMARAKR